MPLPPAGSGTLALASEPVSLGDEITFVVTGTDGLDNPRVWIAAFQDGNLVYGQGIGAAETFKLGGGSSDWVTNGGPAECTAQLYYILNKNGHSEWNGHGDQGGPVQLAVLTFHAEG